jgi:uncharacterized caspase-like protein
VARERIEELKRNSSVTSVAPTAPPVVPNPNTNPSVAPKQQPAITPAGRRVALVIGNSGYRHTGALVSPRNDATDMAAALRTQGFHVIDGYDLDRVGIERNLREFAKASSGAEVGLFFYAGHAIQVSGLNFMVPVDARLEASSAVDSELVRLDVVQRLMEQSAQSNILFIDASRDNPLARNLARALGTNSVNIGRGLAKVEAEVGTLISFSQQPGNVAPDGNGRNSPFSSAFVRRLSSSNDDLQTILIDVRKEVIEETQRRQVTWDNSALTGRVYFKTAATVR